MIAYSCLPTHRYGLCTSLNLVYRGMLRVNIKYLSLSLICIESWKQLCVHSQCDKHGLTTLFVSFLFHKLVFFRLKAAWWKALYVLVLCGILSVLHRVRHLWGTQQLLKQNKYFLWNCDQQVFCMKYGPWRLG